MWISLYCECAAELGQFTFLQSPWNQWILQVLLHTWVSVKCWQLLQLLLWLSAVFFCCHSKCHLWMNFFVAILLISISGPGKKEQKCQHPEGFFVYRGHEHQVLLHDPCDRIFFSVPQLWSYYELESWRWEVSDKHAELPHAAQHLIAGKESQKGFDPKLQDTFSDLTDFSVLYCWDHFLLR